MSVPYTVSNVVSFISPAVALFVAFVFFKGVIKPEVQTASGTGSCENT